MWTETGKQIANLTERLQEKDDERFRWANNSELKEKELHGEKVMGRIFRMG